MPRMTSQTIWRFGLSLLFVFPGFVLADQAGSEDYLGSKQLLLEVRYCECDATKSNSRPSDLLLGFLEGSSILGVAVSAEDKGFISSDGFQLGMNSG